MKGWVTWCAVAGFCLLSINDFANGDIEAGFVKLTSAGSLVGIGRKVERSVYADASARQQQQI